MEKKEDMGAERENPRDMAKPKKFNGVIGKRKSARHPSKRIKVDECGLIPNEKKISLTEYLAATRKKNISRARKSRIPLTKI